MIEEIKKYDPHFLESKFKSFIDNVFIQIHLSIMTKDIEKIKHFVTEDIYQKLFLKVNSLKENNYIQMYDEINVKETHLIGVEVIENEIFVSVNLTSRYMDYMMDENGKFISGNNQSRIERVNSLIFKKKLGESETNSVKKCPSCSHPMDINQNGKCEYCGSIYNLESSGWILTSMEVL